jgi:tripartite-type tricarboxylate transporter receptor subunit TctC
MRTMLWTKALRYLGLLTIFLIASSGNAQQPQVGSEKRDDVTKFFKGKIITFIVGSRAGGSYDMLGRMLAESLGKYTGATVIVKNVEGGGGIQGANMVYSSNPDGLSMGIINAGLLQTQTLEGKGVKFDLGKYTWFGRVIIQADGTVVGAKSKYKSVEELLSAKGFKEGNAGAGSTGYFKSVLRAEAIGWNAEMVSGYANTSEMLLALIRGEIDVVATTWDVIHPFVKSGEVIPILTSSENGIPGYPEVRTLSKIPVVTKRLSERGKELLDLEARIGADGLGRIVAGPPGIPPDRAGYLEEMIQKKILTDPEFIKKTGKMGEYTIGPLSGSDTLRDIKRLISIIEKHRSVIEEGLKRRQR